MIKNKIELLKTEKKDSEIYEILEDEIKLWFINKYKKFINNNTNIFNILS